MDDERRRFYVDPVAFGELVGSVRALAASVERLSIKVDDLMESRSTSKGILAGLAIAGGGVGALAHKLLEGVFK